MWSNDILWRLSQLRQADFLKQAEQERMARQAAANARRSVHAAKRLLVWLGRQLIVTGERLQGYPTGAMTTAVLRSVHHGR
jgi:hypothetical protein